MEKHIKDYFTTKKTKRFSTEDLEIFLKKKLKREFETMGGYRTFSMTLTKMVEQNEIKPILAKGKNSMEPPLYIAYQRIVVEQLIPAEEKKRIFNTYHPKMTMIPYIKNYNMFLNDEFYLNQINNFLKAHRAENADEEMSVNERSFALFNDEKWLQSKEGQTLLQRIGIKLDDLACYDTYEPFFYVKTQLSKEKKEINVLIVENKDTFYTLKRLLQKNGINKYVGTQFDMLIYGEGKKIVRSIGFINEIEDIREFNWHMYYFGDIDPEGIAIYSSLNDSSDFDILPYEPFYRYLIDKYRGEEIVKRKKEQNVKAVSYKPFFSKIDKELVNEIEYIVKSDGYLPQEGISRIDFIKMSLL